MAAFSFQVQTQARDSLARTAVLTTPHGEIRTPVFAPVGTQASVKSLLPPELTACGPELILANTYHLYLRPGSEIVQALGGIHRFMSTDLPIMTDSGGFQVFSLGSAIRDGVGKIASIFPSDSDQTATRQQDSAPFVAVHEDRVVFRSHLDGQRHTFTPEKSIRVQSEIGADFILAFDECTSPFDDHDYTAEALQRTHRWALESHDAYQRYCRSERQALFGIVQGGAYQDLREQSAAFLGRLPCFGYSVGGSLGKSKTDMHHILDWVIPALPADKPRHMLGIGHIEDIVNCVERGIDIFDCVIPTRWARTGAAIRVRGLYEEDGAEFEGGFRVHLRNARFRNAEGPIDPHCSCQTCQRYTAAYLHYLYREKASLAYTLVSIHNVHSMAALMAQIRKAIDSHRFGVLKNRLLRS